MSKKFFLEQNKEQMLNIIEALQFFRDNALKPKYKSLIDNQLSLINQQLEAQKISILHKKNKPMFNFGEKIKYENQDGIIIGMSNENEFIKIVINEDNKLKEIEVPIVLVEKEKKI